MNTNSMVLSGIMVVAGIGIPVMASMNASVGTRIGAPMTAVAILSGVALIAAIFLAATLEEPKFGAVRDMPRAYFLAGGLFVLYIGSITIAAPRIGLGNAVFFVLIGQIVSAATIDHFGLLGSPVLNLTPKRMLGIIFMAIGVYLARREIMPPIPVP